MNSLSNFIKEVRKRKNVSLRKMASEIGLSKSYLYNLEIGNATSPSIEVLDKIAKYAETDISELVEMVRHRSD